MPPKKPNVLFLIADDLNCDLGCYGHRRSRRRTSTRWRRAACGSSGRIASFRCAARAARRFSRAAGRTRRRFTRTRRRPQPDAIYGASPHFREFIPDTVTLPQLFRSNGYFVARVGKLYHYGVPGQIGTQRARRPAVVGASSSIRPAATRPKRTRSSRSPPAATAAR